jgi:hypothetical protein
MHSSHEKTSTFFPDHIAAPAWARFIDDQRIVITSLQMLYILFLYFLGVIISYLAIPD